MGLPTIEASTEERILVLPALYGSGEETHQVMLFLSLADGFWRPGQG